MDAGPVFAASPVPQLLLDARHRVVQANPAWISRLGADPAGQPWIDLVHPADAAGEIPCIGRLQSDRIGYRIALRLLQADGAWRQSAVAVVPLGDGALATLLPEDGIAMPAAHDHLAEERGLLAAALSHDLFQHARLANLYLQLLERAALDAPQRKRLDTAADHVQRLTATLTHLAHWLRLADQPIEAAPCDLGPIVRRATAVFPGRGAEIGDLPALSGDPALLEELFTALVDNAVGYAAGPVRIGAQRDGGRWVIEVADQGPGIPPAERLRVLEPLRRLHTWEEKPGYGMGLALAARIAARHGGSLAIEGGTGGGCVVRVVLPG